MSHKSRTSESRGMFARNTSHGSSQPPVSKGLQIRYDTNTISLPKRSSVGSVISSGRYSDSSTDNSRAISSRPSALPRSTSSGSQARLSYIASTRPMPSFAGKSPPLQALSIGQPISNIPRLDALRTTRPLYDDRKDSTFVTSPDDQSESAVIGLAISEESATNSAVALLIPELRALAASNRLPSHPASSSIGNISSPSTVFTTSSSPWSANTTTTTPLSWSTPSPHLAYRSISAQSKRSYTVPTPTISKAKKVKPRQSRPEPISYLILKERAGRRRDLCGKVQNRLHLHGPLP